RRVGFEIKIMVDELPEHVEPGRRAWICGRAILPLSAGSARDDVADDSGVGSGDEPIICPGGEVERRQRELRTVGRRIEAWIRLVIAGSADWPKFRQQFDLRD